jgi:nucleosome binding factor SPN SPT16 subunit
MNQLSAKYGCDSMMFAYDLPVLVQSADVSKPEEANFTLNKFNQNADKTDLNESLIFINVCGKYVDMNAMACRTILIDPNQRQKDLYVLATQAKDHLSTNIASGATFDSLYKSTKKFILSKDSSLADRLHSNFGFSIGLAHKEELLIAEGNMAKVKAGMTLHIRITFRDSSESSAEGKRLTLAAVGDTVCIEGTDKSLSVNNLTAKIPCAYERITYKLADEDEDGGKEN